MHGERHGCVCLIILLSVLTPIPTPGHCACNRACSFYFLHSHTFLAVIAVTTEWLTLS